MYYLDLLKSLKQKYRHLDVNKYKPLIEQEKIIFKQEKNDDILLKIWLCLEIIESINNYHDAFEFLKEKKYNKGWSKFARAEINIRNIIYNIPNHKDYLIVSFLNQYVRKYQSIFPYKIFMSTVSITKKSECSICGNDMNPFSDCKHMRGRVYSGELCYETITDMDFLRIDMVTNPSMKDCVVFNDMENPDKYPLLEFLMSRLKDEYDMWDYKIIQKHENHNMHKIGRNKPCPCRSGKKYKYCCMNNPKGIIYDDYEFVFPNK
jgi:hypothetical protein